MNNKLDSMTLSANAIQSCMPHQHEKNTVVRFDFRKRHCFNKRTRNKTHRTNKTVRRNAETNRTKHESSKTCSCTFAKSSYNNLLLLIFIFGLLTSVQALINEVSPVRSERLLRTPNTTPKDGVAQNGYINKLDNMAAVLMKTGSSSITGSQTTKRSLPDRPIAAASSLTTIPPPLLTTLRYSDKFPHQSQAGLHHRNYELDLERDHALPTSAPNADILKSNSNPTYPNPNRHNHGHDRERHRHVLNSTPVNSNFPTSLKKNNNGQPNGNDMPSYSPPARAFFTPPLPPEYQNPFADKPTLRGTHNEGLVPTSLGNGNGPQSPYINRRPIPPPSLMPGHERIPLRPPDAPNASNGNADGNTNKNIPTSMVPTINSESNGDILKKNKNELQSREPNVETGGLESKQDILPNIGRIFSGSNGSKGEIPEVLLKQVTMGPVMSSHQPPSSPVVLLDGPLRNEHDLELSAAAAAGSNINHKKTDAQDTKLLPQNELYELNNGPMHMGSVAVKTENDATIAAATATSSSTTVGVDRDINSKNNNNNNNNISGSSTSVGTSSSSTSVHTTWTIAWNVHVYLSVILFTILAVYSFYKLLTYNKLTHLFSQSYFLCIHLVLVTICTTRIFYLCYDAYNVHGSFQLFISELLLNLPATLLTISFSVLILFLFRNSLNHKHNRYSALIRPLTVIVGCGVHVVLCITLHYVESYTMQNFYLQQQQQIQHQQHQQQQQQFYYQQQVQKQRQQQTHNYFYNMHYMAATSTSPAPPPRVLSLICQIIYIFVCFSLGLLYLYLYRILKRILRSKSQNYIHGHQSLSYAIHITIATALLFVLMAILQVFGAIGIAAKRPLTAVVEIDWLQWGYQFSLRLIEVAIITLISWVAGLKTKSSGGGSAAMPVGTSMNGGLQGSGREKFGTQRNQHSSGGVSSGGGGGGFFLPCTSTSSQEQFETDYPAVCSANTNLHTYTMRTGKLIYDDSFALNALGQGHNSNPNYQRPYDTNSLRSGAGVKYQQRYPQHTYHQHHQYATTDYLTDATTDHYENPNFDLQTTANPVMKFTKTDSSATSTTTASSKSGGGPNSGASSQQQMLLLQSESCYSEPNYDFNNFERPKFGSAAANQRIQRPLDNTDRRSNSNSCASSGSSVNFTTYGGGGGGGGERRSGKRFANYNSFERGSSRHANGVRKSGTLNNIISGGGKHSIVNNGSINQHQLAAAEICYRNDNQAPDNDYNCERPPTLERSNSRTPLQVHHHSYTHQNRTELDDDNAHLTDDIIVADITSQTAGI